MRRSKAERFKVVPFSNPSGNQVWRVRGYGLDGKQVRMNVRSPEEAFALKCRLENEALCRREVMGLRRTRLSDEQLADAEAAIARLGVLPVSLLQAVEHFQHTYQPDLRERDLEEAVREFLDDKKADNLRPKTLKDYRSRLGLLVRGCADKRVHEISVEELRPIIKRPKTGPDCQNGVRRCFLTFFRWALHRKYCSENPVASVGKTRCDRQRPRILTPAEVQALLQATQDYMRGRMVPYLVLALFAGLRHAEIQRLCWSKIYLEQDIILIDGTEAKLRQNREIEIRSNLGRWLSKYENQPLYPSNFRRDIGAIRHLAGFVGTRRAEEDQNAKPWQQNILRHTAISYYFASVRDEGKTAAFAGNSPDIIHRFYRNRVSRKDADLFWAMDPIAIEQGFEANAPS